MPAVLLASLFACCSEGCCGSCKVEDDPEICDDAGWVQIVARKFEEVNVLAVAKVVCAALESLTSNSNDQKNRAC